MALLRRERTLGQLDPQGPLLLASDRRLTIYFYGPELAQGSPSHADPTLSSQPRREFSRQSLILRPERECRSRGCLRLLACIGSSIFLGKLGLDDHDFAYTSKVHELVVVLSHVTRKDGITVTAVGICLVALVGHGIIT